MDGVTTDTDTPSDTARYALPTSDLLDGYGVVQIVLMHEKQKTHVVDMDLTSDCVGIETIGLLDVCREIKRRRMEGTLPPVQVIQFFTSYADSDNPTPDLIWVYDREVSASRAIVQVPDRSDVFFDTWDVKPAAPTPSR